MSRRHPERPTSHEPWPGPLDARDPFIEPDHFDPSKVHADYETAGGTLSAEVVLDATTRFREALRQAWTTGASPSLAGLASTLLLDHSREHNRRHYVLCDNATAEDELARIATDMVPAMANDAADRLLGPWAAIAHPLHDARLLQIATAAGAFMMPEEAPFDARHQWTRRKPQPPDDERAAVRAVAHAPFTAFPIEAVGEHWRLGPGVGTPSPGLVRVDAPASLPGQPKARPGDTLVARVVVGHGPFAIARLPIVVAGPIPDAAEGWLDLLLLEQRLADRRAGPRDVLRLRGHILARRVLEAAWIR